MILNNNTLKGINTSFSAIYNQAFEGAPSQFEEIATTVPSTKGENAYPWLGMTTRFREWLGDRVIQNLKTHGYTIKNKKFENTVAVKVDDIEDDNLGIYKPLVENLAYDSKTHPDILIFDLLKNGTSYKCYDGQPFFDTDHPVIKDGKEVSVSNYKTGTGEAWYLLDTSRPIKPLIFQKRKDYKLKVVDDDKSENVFNRDEILYGVDARCNAGYGLWQMAYCSKQELTSANFAAAYAAMASFKGDNGKPLGIRPTILLVSPQNFSKANEVITADRLANGQSNPNKNLVKVVMAPWLA